MQNLYLSLRYLLIGYIFSGLIWIVEDLIQPTYPNLSNYFEASCIAFYILVMYFVTLAIFSLEKKSKILRIAGWLIVITVIMAMWSMIPEKQNQKDIFYSVAELCSFMSGYYIVVEYSKIVEKSALQKANKFAHLIRKGIAFADIFFIMLLIPIALSIYPNLTNTLVNINLYIYYIIWIFFVVFLTLCTIEIRKELKQKTT